MGDFRLFLLGLQFGQSDRVYAVFGCREDGGDR